MELNTCHIASIIDCQSFAAFDSFESPFFFPVFVQAMLPDVLTLPAWNEFLSMESLAAGFDAFRWKQQNHGRWGFIKEDQGRHQYLGGLC